MIPLARPEFLFANLPHDLQPLPGIRNSALRPLWRFALNAFFNGIGNKANAEADAAAVASSAQHV